MRGKLAILGGTALALVFAVVAVGATAGEAPETTMIDDCVIKKGPVAFNHKAHVDRAECVTCHHTQEGLTADSTEEVESCGACHNEPEDEATPVCSQMSKSKNPFHITCIGCHKEMVDAGESETAPTKCTECHPKAE